MKKDLWINGIGAIEVAIGVTTLLGLISMPLLYGIKKPVNILVFVLISSLVSSALGGGLLLRKEWARSLLVFFSGYVLITKLLLATGLLYFTGESELFLPLEIKNIISTVYHLCVIIILSAGPIKRSFIKSDGVK